MAHQREIILEIPEVIETTMTDEQTNHSFFQGKETRNKAMLKAKQVQMHKRNKAIKTKNILKEKTEGGQIM